MALCFPKSGCCREFALNMPRNDSAVYWDVPFAVYGILLADSWNYIFELSKFCIKYLWHYTAIDYLVIE